MDARSILAQLASDVELGPGMSVGDEQMTVGAAAHNVFLEVGPMTCTMAREQAESLALWLALGEDGDHGEQQACEWEGEGVTGLVACVVRRLMPGEVYVDLQGTDEDPEALWSGCDFELLHAVRSALALAVGA